MEKLSIEVVGRETYTIDRGTEWEMQESIGHKVFNSHPLAKLKEDITGVSLFLGSYEVRDYVDVEFENKIPVWYCVRTFIDNRYRFVCGLDLMSDGKVWLGLNGSYFDSVEEAMDFVKQKEGKECVIFTEEKIRL
jgi:hypothetical protein